MVVRGKATVVRATRPFPAATRMLLPLAPGRLPIVLDTVHPRSVPVSMASRVLYVLLAWKVTWPPPFWAVRRTSVQAESNVALAEVLDNAAHSFVAVGSVAAPGARRVLTEGITSS